MDEYLVITHTGATVKIKTTSPERAMLIVRRRMYGRMFSRYKPYVKDYYDNCGSWVVKKLPPKGLKKLLIDVCDFIDRITGCGEYKK